MQSTLTAMTAAHATLLDPTKGKTLDTGIQDAIVDTNIAGLDSLSDFNALAYVLRPHTGIQTEFTVVDAHQGIVKVTLVPHEKIGQRQASALDC